VPEHHPHDGDGLDDIEEAVAPCRRVLDDLGWRCGQLEHARDLGAVILGDGVQRSQSE